MNKLHKIYFSFAILLVGFASCEKPELPITLPAKGDGIALQVDMGSDYTYQFYINLAQQKVVHVSRIDMWDLAFQSGSNEHFVYLNGGKGMAAFNTHKKDFASVGLTDSLNSQSAWSYDAPSGETDSTAIGDWSLSNDIYLIRLDEAGKKIRKIQIKSEDAFQYVIAVGDINTVTPVEFTVVKNGNQNFTYFSFSYLNTVDGVEPDKSSWDIIATRYNVTFYDQTPALPYVVNGFLLNPSNTLAYKDSLTDYNAIDGSFSNSVSLSSKRDVIGFDWKVINEDHTQYNIVKKYNYVVKTQENHLFKLHFLDFYSATGIKGSPKFEFKELQ